MPSAKFDEFTRCFSVFVGYLNVVAPLDRQDGVLDVRIGISSDESGLLRYWMQDRIVSPDEDDALRFFCVDHHVLSFLGDLNFCRAFVDDKIAHTFDLFDQDGELRFAVVRMGLGRGVDD